MTDDKKMCLRDTIIPKSDQLNYDDVANGPLVVRVVGLAQGSKEQPVIVKVVNAATGLPIRADNPVYKPCKGMRRVLIACWGDSGKDWIGKLATLVGNADVVYGGAKVGGIQISAVSGIDGPRKIMLTTTRSKRVEYTVEAMTARASYAAATDGQTKEGEKE